MPKTVSVLSFGFATLCVADVHCKASSGQTCSSMMLQTSSQVDTSVTYDNPCASCSVCVAVPRPSQGGINDNACAPCAMGKQTWWPCNTNPYQCECASTGPDPTPRPTLPPQTPMPTSDPTPDPTPIPTAQPTVDPTPLPPAPTPQPPMPTVAPTQPPPVIIDPTPEPTAPTPQPTLQPTPQPTPQPTRQPTPTPTLQPSAQPTSQPTPQPTPQPIPQPPAPTPSPTEETVTEPPSTDCRTCDQCIAIRGNPQSANDEHCNPCARGGQSWWPCNVDGLCTCAGASPAATPLPTRLPTTAPAPPSPTPAPPTPPVGSTPTPQPTSSSSSSGEQTISEWFTAADFQAFFPNINTSPCTGRNFFTYEAFIEAAAAYPAFAGSGDLLTDKRELAAFLGQTSHETTGGWATAPGGPFAWGYCWKEEVGCESGGCTQYCQAGNANYPCTAGQTYQGRGPMQLSWNYNYGAFSEASYGDKTVLLNNPALVASDPVVAYKAALWFWMTPQWNKPSCHAVMSGKWVPTAADVSAGRTVGFGMTTNVINGGIECNKPTDAKVEDRVGFYKRYASILSVSVDESTLYCNNMASFR